MPRTAVHNGVAKLLTNIHKNGYRILYIAQSNSTALGTKEHLAKLSAGSDIKLPPGPVFQSPDSLIRAFGPARTDLFKAAALRYEMTCCTFSVTVHLYANYNAFYELNRLHCIHEIPSMALHNT